MNPTSVTKIAFMGGAYGNVPALNACINDALSNECNSIAFLGDAIGFCGHSNETLRILKQKAHLFIAGNLEQQAASGATTCDCGYATKIDEDYGCKAFEWSLKSLSETNKKWIAQWPESLVIETPAGKVLLCHGSPDQSNEFLYASQTSSQRVKKWLKEYNVIGLVCTHTGIPWLQQLSPIRFAANCGVTGKPDHDGDTAVHYILGSFHTYYVNIEIRRVEYDYQAWAKQMRKENVDEIFIAPLETGIWTCGRSSLPAVEDAISKV